VSPQRHVGNLVKELTHRTTRVLLVDDHDVVREGIRRLLGRDSGLQVVGEADSGEAALALVAELHPDVILMDLRMPGIGGVEATRQIAQQHPSVRVLVLSAFAELAPEALAAGAAGYLTKTTDHRQLTAAIRSVALGSTVIQGDLAVSLATAKRQAEPPEAGGGGLSHRELQVLRLMARGLTNRAIAKEVGIAPRTTDQHVHNILVKARVGTRIEAVRYALEHRLIATTDA
jgi:two-component system, NarL family, response regulator LiaR